MTQRTWTDLLGPFNPDTDSIDWKSIVRQTGPGTYQILWTFATALSALRAFHAWQRGE